MPDNFSQLKALLMGRDAMSPDVLRPLYVGPVVYSDGNGSIIDVLKAIPKILPKRYLSAEDIPKPINITREQCIGLVRAFRNHNSVEAACLMLGVKVKDFTDMQRTWAVGRTKESAIPKQYRAANEFIERLFLAFTVATDLAEREYIQVVSSAALNGSKEVTTKSVTYFDERGKEVGGKTETVTRIKPPDAGLALVWLERTNPGRWGQKKTVEHGGTVHHAHSMTGGIGQEVEADPLSVVMSAIEKIGRDPLPLPEPPDPDLDDVMDAEFSDQATSNDDEGGDS